MGLSGTARHRVSILAEKYDGIYKLEDHGGFHREAPKATHTHTWVWHNFTINYISQDIQEKRAAGLAERRAIPYLYLQDTLLSREKLFLSEKVEA